MPEQKTQAPAGFTCPRCGRTSYHPHDVEHGYCGACHAFTRDDSERRDYHQRMQALLAERRRLRQ